MSKYTFSLLERYAVWSFHGPRCYWCLEPVLWRDTQVDHVIPEALGDNPDKLREVVKSCGLPGTFQLNDYCNWMPIHGRCNSSKQDADFTVAPKIVQILLRLQSDAPKVRAIEQQFQEDMNSAEILFVLCEAFDKGNITIDQIQAFLAEKAGQIGIHLKPMVRAVRLAIDEGRWTVAPDVRGGLVTVTDGKRFGVTPIEVEAGSDYICPNCGQAGPWSGRICMNCNHRHYPDD